jgi:hypothetical protein
MANIRTELGRHIWRRQLMRQGFEKVWGFHCENCRAYRFTDNESILPVTGCISDIRVANCGDSRLADYREQEMRRRKELDDAERAEDLAVMRGAHPTRLEQHLEQLLKKELR